MADDAIISQAATDLYERIATGQQPTEADKPEVSQLLNMQLIRHQTEKDDYVLANPAYVGARLTADFHKEASRHLDLASQVGAAFERLRAAYMGRCSVGDGTVEYLVGAAEINARLGQVLADCTESLDASQPNGPRRPKLLATVRERDLATLGRGVRMRTLYQDDARAGVGMHEWVADMTAAGAEIRTLDADFPRMIIIDRRSAVIPGEREEIARIIHDAGVASFLSDWLFGGYWAKATPWVGDGDPERSLISAQQDRVLKLLAAGKTRQHIAKALKISERRVAAVTAELKAAYEAETLFQLACRWRDQQSAEQSSAGPA